MRIVKQNNHEGFRKLKILWVSFLRLDVDLHKVSRLEILNELAERGHDVCMVAVRTRTALQTKNLHVRIISVPLRYIPIISPLMFAVILFFFLPLYIIISKRQYVITEPDVSIFGFMSLIPFLKLKTVKLILDIRSTPVETVDFTGRLRSLCFSASVFVAKKFFNGLTTITPMMKNEVCKKFGINPKLVGVWSSGVSATLFNPESHVSDGEELKRKLGLSNKFVVFYHGAFSANRGLVETIKAMCIIKRVRPDIVLFLLGTGPVVNSLKDLVDVNKLQNNVVIHDPVDYMDVPKYIAMADVGIVPLPNNPYWRFQCPLNLLEYLAMGKAVIITNIPAHRLIIGNENCGIYITSSAPTEIARSIIYAEQNKEKLREWGAIGRAIIYRKYTWKKVALDLENYLLAIDNKTTLHTWK